MSSLLFLCFFIAQLMIIWFYTFNYRTILSNMTGMIVSMSVGMSSGILFGTYAGIIWRGDLFQSTMIAVLISVTVGFIFGLPIGVLAIIDGMLAGLMGGMMGAMLGDMVAMTKPDTSIKLLTLVITTVLLLVLYSMEEDVRKQGKQIRFSLFTRPYLLLFILTAIFIGLHTLSF